MLNMMKYAYKCSISLKLLRNIPNRHYNRSFSFLKSFDQSKTTLSSLYREIYMLLYEGGLTYGQGTGDANDETAIILSHQLQLPTDVPISTLKNQVVALSDVLKIKEIVNKRLSSQAPLSYIINAAYQQGHTFYVDHRTVIPRSYLGEVIYNKKLWSQRPAAIMYHRHIHHILDMCCGSGCLGILAYKAFSPHIKQVDMVDISSDALDVAKINITKHMIDDKVSLYHGNMFDALKGASYHPIIPHHQQDMKLYDMILCNPPYVDQAGVEDLPTEFQQEPMLAFEGGQDGLKYIDIALHDAYHHLNDGGMMLMEIGRCAPSLIAKYPLVFVPRKKQFQNIHDYPASSYARWIDTKLSTGEVFSITKLALKALIDGHGATKTNKLSSA